MGGELLGLRAWRLARWAEDGGVRLCSLSRMDLWHGPVFASDFKPLAESSCGAGVYAMKAEFRPRVNTLGIDGTFETDWLSGRDAWIWGWIALSGQVIEHALGYRAERAVVRRLHLGVQAHLACHSPAAVAALVRELEDRYQCPVRAGYWEPRKALRIVGGIRDMLDSLPSIPVVQPPAPACPVPPGAPVPPSTSSPATVAPASQSLRIRRLRRPRRPVPRPLLKREAVVKAFRKAERLLGHDWPVKGRGHCRRATIRNPYDRDVRPVTRSWKYFSPHDALGRRHVFPMAVIEVAAKILGVALERIMLREY
jgi:hypothetical protein